jgi:hypothetical protein
MSEETFKQKLAAIVGEDKVEAVCQLMKAEVIGSCELYLNPDFASPDEIDRWHEKNNDTAARNALRREQWRKLQ